MSYLSARAPSFQKRYRTCWHGTQTRAGDEDCALSLPFLQQLNQINLWDFGDWSWRVVFILWMVWRIGWRQMPSHLYTLGIKKVWWWGFVGLLHSINETFKGNPGQRKREGREFWMNIEFATPVNNCQDILDTESQICLMWDSRRF